MSADVQLIFVGRLVDIKNPTKLPDIVSNLPSAYSLLIIGDGPKREAVEVAVDEKEVGGRIKLVGHLPHQETLKLIHESDILILPSETESYGAVVFEALSLSTPVVASPVGILSMVDNPNLNIAEIEDFADTIPEISVEESDGINSDTLEEFAVERFATSVREHMLEVMERDPQPDS
jgi:glycosyltransferase involved in cell wall biosynthesis